MFNNMSLSELLALNKEICQLIRQKRSADAAVKVIQLAVGDRVRYEGSPKCAPFEATVQKVLRVNVDVITDSGKPWRISAASLMKVPTKK